MKLFNSLLIIVLLCSVGLTGDDGSMWMPHQMKDLKLKSKGLEMNPSDLYKKDGTGLMSAIVSLGGGTGEFVSKEGLILTNHHVAFGAIQRASNKDNDYIKNGFLAADKTKEIRAIGSIADVLLGYDDVTKYVVRGLKKSMAPGLRQKVIEKNIKRIIARFEKKGKDLRGSVKAMFSGNVYYLFKYKRLRDIRLVYAPPQSLGNYGGDIDNWMWPRHTCDFTFLRAYVSRDNVGAAYSKDNVPYKPKSFLKVSLDGVKEGDFTFVMGYPGRTYKNYTFAELKESSDSMKSRVKDFKAIIDFFEAAGKKDRGIQIKYASLVKGLNNAFKNYTGKLEGFEKYNVFELKKKSEDAFAAWINSDEARKKKYGNALKNVEKVLAENVVFSKKNKIASGITSSYFGSAVLSQAYTILRTVQESAKPDMKRDMGFQKKNMPYIKTRIKFAERRYDFNVDKAFFKFQLKRLLKEPAEIIPAALKPVLANGEAGIDKYVDEMYAKTILKDVKKRLELLKYKPKKLYALKDPFIQLAAELEKGLKAIRKKAKSRSQKFMDVKKLQLAALLAMKEGRLAPDANSTIRFTYGPIKGYNPKDAVVYDYQTTLGGVIEKNTGKKPFNAPAKLVELYKKKDFGRYENKEINDVTTCFLNTTCVTGGNSGSPVLNAKGEQIGIIFDMTYESVTGDYYVIPDYLRTISVDIRYVLFVTEKFSGAHHIVKEVLGN